jgi:hypothetical protein
MLYTAYNVRASLAARCPSLTTSPAVTCCKLAAGVNASGSTPQQAFNTLAKWTLPQLDLVKDLAPCLRASAYSLSAQQLLQLVQARGGSSSSFISNAGLILAQVYGLDYIESYQLLSGLTGSTTVSTAVAPSPQSSILAALDAAYGVNATEAAACDGLTPASLATCCRLACGECEWSRVS